MSGWGQAHINNTIGFGGGVSCGSFTGLLDDYSGAAAAYSLRQLSSSYTGSAIRVRRSSDNAEQDIGFVSNELDTVSLLSFVGANDGFVTTWYDQSGGSNDATQGSAASQPQVVSSGSLITQFGKPAIDTNGSSSEFEFNSFNTNGFYFAVIGANTGTGTIITGGDDTNNRFDYGPRASNSYRLLTRNLSNGTTIDSGINTVGSYLFSATKDSSTNGEIFLNGTSQQSGADVRDLLAYSNTNRLFSRYAVSVYADYIAGKWNEVIIWNSDQSANRTGIETNINNFYSIY